MIFFRVNINSLILHIPIFLIFIFLKENYQKEILGKINIPLGLEAREKLKTLQLNIKHDLSQSFTYENTSAALFKDPILTIQCFQSHEKKLLQVINQLHKIFF